MSFKYNINEHKTIQCYSFKLNQDLCVIDIYIYNFE